MNLVIFNKEHFKTPFTLHKFTGVNGRELNISTPLNEKIKIVAASIFVGLFTLGIGGAVAFYVLSARAKIKKIEAAGYNVRSLLTPNPMKHTSITYELNGGRFGDSLMTYLAAKWISYKTGYPLYYKAFQYSDQLTLDHTEPSFSSSLTFKNTLRHDSPEAAKKVQEAGANASLLVIVPFFNSSNPDWDDPDFKKIAQNLLQPKQPTPLSSFPEGSVSVAIHVRKGGGFDDDKVKKQMPTKFPPDEYYLEGLKEIAKLYPEKKLYAYLFTDDPSPASIASTYKQALPPDLNVEFDFNREKNAHNVGVIEDFFFMAQFQCIIRPDSCFSLGAGILGNHEICYRPKEWGGVQEIEGKIYVPGVIEDKRRVRSPSAA